MEFEHKLGETVYLKIGMQILPLIIDSISVSGQRVVYGLSMVFRKGKQNESKEHICDATSDMFYKNN